MRYAHRLHGVLLIAHGFAYRTVATLLGDAPRTLSYWWRRYREAGLAALREPPPHGRPKRLTAAQIQEVVTIIRESAAGTRWTGKMMAELIGRRFGIQLSTRQARRILHDLGQSKRPPDVG